MSKSSMKKVAIGAAVAGVAGYVAGLLTAPKSGKETRADIKHAAVMTTAEAEKRLKELHTEMSQLLAQAKAVGSKYAGKTHTELDKLVAKANAAKEKARVILSAIHEGDAEDKDLKKVIDDASSATKHLKDFLSK